MNNNWKNFVDATKTRQPIKLLDTAINQAGDASTKERQALDLGCGAGVDAKHLAQNGFIVTAVDNDDCAIKQTAENCRDLNVITEKEDIYNFKIEKNKYSVIIAWNSLPFLDKKRVENVLKNIKDGLVNNGVFVFSIFGKNDDWKDRENMSFWDLEEFKKFMADFKFVELYEKQKEEAGATGNVKFWHLIQGIAKK